MWALAEPIMPNACLTPFSSKKRTIRSNRDGVVNKTYGMVDQVFRKMVALISSFWWLDSVVIVGEFWVELVGFAIHETVETVKASGQRPLVERPGLAGHELGRVVVLPEPGSAVAVVAQNRANGCRILVDDAVVAGVTGRRFRDHPEADVVMVSPGDQCCPRR